jgi:hypothetical protein
VCRAGCVHTEPAEYAEKGSQPGQLYGQYESFRKVTPIPAGSAGGLCETDLPHTRAGPFLLANDPPLEDGWPSTKA